MYGLILENFRCVILEKFGEPVWNKMVEKSGIQHCTFAMHKIYSEDLMSRLIQAAYEVTQESKEDIFEDVGLHFLGFIGRYGYDRILKVLGRHMRDFLSGLDNLHEYLRFTYPKLRAPSFFCDEETENGLKLYYRSSRKGYVYYVVGQIKAVGRFFYHMEVDVKLLDYTESRQGSTTVFQLTFDNSVYMQSRRKLKRHSVISLNGDIENLRIQMDVFYEVFPFHIVYDQNMVILSVGNSLHAVLPGLPGKNVSTQFSLIRPFVDFTWETVITHTNVVFELQAVARNAMASGQALQNGHASANDDDQESCGVCYIHLKGQMLFMEEWHSMVYLATPIIEKLDVMRNLGLYINDLSMHDSSRDLVLAGTQQSAELRLALDQELLKSAKLEESMKELDIEKRRTDSLLYQMIPRSVADRLRQGEPALNTCEMFNDVSVLFSDVVGFTKICSLISPMEVVTMLNHMYTSFDQISEEHNVYKVETIGDAYMVVSGVPERSKYHAEHVADLALNMIEAMPSLSDPSQKFKHLRIRIGVHTGMVVAGVVGLKMPRYCLFGDTVNTASRMESTGLAMKIHISETTYTSLKNSNYLMKQRGSIDIKGKGGMKTYWLLGKRKDGVEEAQSYTSFVGGRCSSVFGGQGEDPSGSLLAYVDLQVPTAHNSNQNGVLAADDEVIVTETNEDPVAYYGHVPHDQSPQSTNNGHFKFGWEKDKSKEVSLPKADAESANGQQHVQSNKDVKKKEQKQSNPASSVSTSLSLSVSP